jgi:CheY-like chemotaxis protein
MNDLSGVNILLVDDEVEILIVLEYMLKRLNANIVTANNGIQAYDIWNKQPDFFNVVITDVSMPGKDADGITLTSRIREISVESVIIVVTGYSRQSEQDAYNVGANVVYAKPFDIMAITSYILKALGKIE